MFLPKGNSHTNIDFFWKLIIMHVKEKLSLHAMLVSLE